MAIERDFEKFKGGPNVATQNRMHVTVRPKGEIYFNENTHRIMGRPAAVALHYSRKRDAIAIEPADPRDPEHFPVKAQYQGWRVRAAPFFGNLGMRFENTLQFVRPDVDNDGVLMLELRETVNVTSKKRKKS
jgi:hypothetical protein